MLKLSKLFYYTNPNESVFSDEIAPTSKQREFLTECRTKIRDYLRPALAEATVRVLGMPKQVEPRFRTQGSWAYKTCIQPAQKGHQEMDLDYGVYLPLEVWQENGPPQDMAKAYFDLVESLLQILCIRENWNLVTGSEAKDTCIRLDVCDWAHIDVPLYVAPAADFERVVERTAVLKAENRAINFALDSLNEGTTSLLKSAQTWEDLNQIMLASRKGEWIPSDPEDVAKWFREQIRRFGDHGEQFLRVCRYIKAWRDFVWQSGGPTSVSLMIAIAQNFKAEKGRDEIALENAAIALGTVLAGELRELGIDDGKEDFNRLSEEDRPSAASLARELGTKLKSARTNLLERRQQALISVREQFGHRIPSNLELIEKDSLVEVVRSSNPIAVAAPIVPNTSAG